MRWSVFLLVNLGSVHLCQEILSSSGSEGKHSPGQTRYLVKKDPTSSALPHSAQAWVREHPLFAHCPALAAGTVRPHVMGEECNRHMIKLILCQNTGSYKMPLHLLREG